MKAVKKLPTSIKGKESSRALIHAKRIITVVCCVIEFKQAYDCIPRNKLWGHLRSCQVPDQIQSILNFYHADEYILLHGDKIGSLQPSFGVKQERPISPLLFTIYMNNIDSVADGVKGVLTGTQNFLVNHMLFAGDIFLMSNDPYACRLC